MQCPLCVCPKVLSFTTDQTKCAVARRLCTFFSNREQIQKRTVQNSVEHVNRSDIELVNKYLRALYNYGVGMCGSSASLASFAQKVYAIMRL